MENNKPTNEIQVELSEEMAQGTYANLAIISHSSSEFILDFYPRCAGCSEGTGEKSRHPDSGQCKTTVVCFAR